MGTSPIGFLKILGSREIIFTVLMGKLSLPISVTPSLCQFMFPICRGMEEVVWSSLTLTRDTGMIWTSHISEDTSTKAETNTRTIRSTTKIILGYLMKLQFWAFLSL
jgi:hypothetical protein